MENKTGIFDKTGKEIYVGDVLQIRLGNHAKKSGGPTLDRVIRFGKHFHLVDASKTEHKYGGRELTEQYGKIAVIVDKEIFR